MKRWTSTWAAMLVAGFLAVPGTALAQTPAAPSSAMTATQDKTAQNAPQDHLQQADAALNSISSSAITGKAKSQIADVKKHVAALEKMAGSAPAASGANSKSAVKWSQEVAAADKILGELLSDTPATGTASASAAAPTAPQPTGTSGMTASSSKANAAVALDDETKAKLTTARASLTAFAAAMSGSASAPAATPKSDSPAATPDSATAVPTSAAPTSASAATTVNPTTSTWSSGAPALSADTGMSSDVSSGNGGNPPKKKSGRRKIKIEFIDDKPRRQITFSKRKAGLMKKAYELTTLTGTQALLLVASETGHVYTFATPKLQPFVTLPEGKTLIQSCLNSADADPTPSVAWGPPGTPYS